MASELDRVAVRQGFSKSLWERQAVSRLVERYLDHTKEHEPSALILRLRGKRIRDLGMPHAAILGRRLNRPVINLGFSGNGRMEKEVGDFLCELDPAVYVLDCLPNMVAKEVAAV